MLVGDYYYYYCCYYYYYYYYHYYYYRGCVACTRPSRGTKARRRCRSRTCLPLRELFHAHSTVAASQMGTWRDIGLQAG